MESYSSFFQSQSGYGRSWNFDALKNLNEISPTVQCHLKQVYFTLCCALVASAVGSYLHVLWNVGGLLTTLACLGCMAWLLSTPPHEENKRLRLLMAAAVFEGASIGPLIDLAIQIDSSILVTAFVGCAIAFGCFSAAAMFARRREFLFLGAFLSSGVSILFWLQFAPFLEAVHLFSSLSCILVFWYLLGTSSLILRRLLRRLTLGTWIT